jgi:hypothetical protein
MRRLLLVSSIALAAGAQARAQVQPAPEEEVGGPRLSAELTQSFVADSNLDLDDPNPGTSYYADTRVILGLLNQTETQTFALGIDTGLRALWQAEEDFEFTFASPTTATLDYGNEWASGSADVFLSYTQTDLDTTLFEDQDLDSPNPGDLREISADATERRYDGGFDLAFATDSPSSYELSLDATRFDYSGRTDGSEDETPRSTVAGEAVWLLELNPIVTGTLTGGYSYYTADNRAETEIRQAEVVAGAVYEPNEVLSLSVGAGYGTYERQQLVGGTRETLDDDSGYVLTAGMRYLFEEVTLNADARLTNAAPQTRLSGTVRAVYPLPNGALSGRVFQRYGGGDTGEEIRVTGAGIGLTHEINQVSSLEFDVNLAKQQNFDSDEADIDRLNFVATYSYALTELVTANVGYRFRSRDQDPESATSNAVFVEIGRLFETSP